MAAASTEPVCGCPAVGGVASVPLSPDRAKTTATSTTPAATATGKKQQRAAAAVGPLGPPPGASGGTTSGCDGTISGRVGGTISGCVGGTISGSTGGTISGGTGWAGSGSTGGTTSGGTPRSGSGDGRGSSGTGSVGVTRSGAGIGPGSGGEVGSCGGSGLGITVGPGPPGTTSRWVRPAGAGRRPPQWPAGRRCRSTPSVSSASSRRSRNGRGRAACRRSRRHPGQHLPQGAVKGSAFRRGTPPSSWTARDQAPRNRRWACDPQGRQRRPPPRTGASPRETRGPHAPRPRHRRCAAPVTRRQSSSPDPTASPPPRRSRRAAIRPPSDDTMTLEGLTSRWTIPRSWAATSVSSSSTPMAATRFGGRGPLSSTSWASVGASASSMTMRAEPSTSTTSKMVTAPQWFRPAAACVSRSSLARNWSPPLLTGSGPPSRPRPDRAACPTPGAPTHESPQHSMRPRTYRRSTVCSLPELDHDSP